MNIWFKTETIWRSSIEYLLWTQIQQQTFVRFCYRKETHTKCLYHCRPSSPSLSINARSAIISLSFNSLTCLGLVPHIDAHPLDLLSAWKSSLVYFRTWQSKILSLSDINRTFISLSILVAAIFKSSIDLNKGVRSMFLSISSFVSSSAFFCIKIQKWMTMCGRYVKWCMSCT